LLLNVVARFPRTKNAGSTDAGNALLRARADSPEIKPPARDAAFADALSAHVQQIEQILGGEQAQWGQLIGEIKPISLNR
jgi:hypothetical protein